MIASDQERDALMAAVERYGNARVFSQDAAQHFFRIRAMLAPPDDAGLRERIAMKLCDIDCPAIENKNERFSRFRDDYMNDADRIIAVLRGEATR